MQLLDLLNEVKYKKIIGKQDINIKEIVIDSNRVVQDSLFIGICGKDFAGKNAL